MDEYDVLLYEINREKKRKEERKFWKGKKWNKEQIRKMEMQDKARLEINQIKGGIELQREHIREQMSLTDTEGMTITEEDFERLINDLTRARPYCGGILSNHVFYQDFSQFANALIKKYFTKE